MGILIGNMINAGRRLVQLIVARFDSTAITFDSTAFTFDQDET
jgi:hypothetical protein